MAADSVSYDSHRGGTAVPAYLNTPPLFLFGLYLSQWVRTSKHKKYIPAWTYTVESDSCASKPTFHHVYCVFVRHLLFFLCKVTVAKNNNNSREKMESAGRRGKVLASAKPDDEKSEKPNWYWKWAGVCRFTNLWYYSLYFTYTLRDVIHRSLFLCCFVLQYFNFLHHDSRPKQQWMYLLSLLHDI